MTTLHETDKLLENLNKNELLNAYLIAEKFLEQLSGTQDREEADKMMSLLYVLDGLRGFLGEDEIANYKAELAEKLNVHLQIPTEDRAAYRQAVLAKFGINS